MDQLPLMQLPATVPAPSGGAPATSGAATSPAGRARAFSFGDPEPVLDRRDIMGLAQALWNGRWYEPPVPMLALARTRHMSPHHASALKFKVNQLVRHFVASRWLSRGEFGRFALDFLAMGNGYLQRVTNLAGGLMTLRTSPATWTRAGRDGVYWWVGDGGATGMANGVAFDRGSVVQLLEHDLVQEVYGIPEWYSAMQAGLLNEEATVFRRRYYRNGSHMGYILYVSEATFDDADADAMEAALEQGKGAGNFRNLMLHLPGGKKDGVQVIPVGEATAKDEFLGIKNTTRDDVLAAHRVPPVLIGVVPAVAGGFGKPSEAAAAFHDAETVPLMMRMLEVNEQLGVEAVRFGPYVSVAGAGAG